MEEKTDRIATKVEEQVALLTETVAQLSFMLEYETMLVSALLYNVKNDMSYRNANFVTPNWKKNKDAYKQVEELCEKIIEANKKDGQCETDKS